MREQLELGGWFQDSGGAQSVEGGGGISRETDRRRCDLCICLSVVLALVIVLLAIAHFVNEAGEPGGDCRNSDDGKGGLRAWC